MGLGGNDIATTLTVQEKVMIHLYRFRAFSEVFDVPEAMCQSGIAKGVGVRRSHISSVIKNLRSKDLVEERLAHIRGGKRRRKVYQLTFKGKSDAKGIVDSLEREGTPLDVVLGKEPSVVETKASVLVPAIKYFFGREEELVSFWEWLNTDGARAFVVQGIPGIGKTTFLTKAIEAPTSNGNRSVFFYTVKEWSGLHSMLTSLSTFLSEMGIGTLTNIVRGHGPLPMDIDTVAKAVLEAGELLIVLDDVQNADDKLVHFLAALLQSETRSGLKVAIAGRTIPPIFSRRDVKVKEKVHELSLDGLSPEDGERLYKAIVKRNDFQKVYALCKGHPLSIELIGLAGGSNIDSSRFIFEEIYRHLSDDEKVTLSSASIYREPVPAEALFIGGGVSFSAIDDLVHRGLLRTKEGLYVAHDLIKDFFYEHMSPNERMGFHRRAADYYLEEGGETLWLEAHYHLIASDDAVRSAGLLMKRASELLRKGYHEEILRVVEELDKRDIGGSRIDVLKVKAEVQNLYGEYEDARRTSKLIVEVAEEHDDRISCIQGRILLGVIAYNLNELEEAIRCYEEALTSAEGIEDSENMAKIYNNLGILHWKRSDISEAIRSYKKSLTIAEEMGDRPGIARIHANIGIIHYDAKRYDDALDSYKKALEMSEQLDDRKTASILHCNIGELHTSMNNKALARSSFKKSLELAEDVGFKQQIEEAKKHLGSL